MLNVKQYNMTNLHVYMSLTTLHIKLNNL